MRWIDFFSFFKSRKKSFSAWQIELTTRCPLKCRMCLREGVDNWHSGDMKIEDFRRLIPYLRDVETVILEGWGESLLHKNLVEIIRLVKAESPQVGFVTSGKGLTGEYISEIIDAGTDFIGFSLSGAFSKTHNAIRVHSDHETLINDIRNFNEIKKSKEIDKPKSHIVYLMLKDNISEVPSLIGLAKDIGIETVILTNPIHIASEWQEGQRVFKCYNNQHPHPNPPPSRGREKLENPLPTITPPSPCGRGLGGGVKEQSRDYEEILKEAEKKAKELKINLRRPYLLPVEMAVCEENPLRNLYISVDGEVSPCVYLYPPISSPLKRIFCGDEYKLEKVSFGNIFRETFDTIWNNRGYIEFRERFIRRKRKVEVEDIHSFLWDKDMGKNRRFEIKPLIEPPEQCKTCHKMLGF